MSCFSEYDKSLSSRCRFYSAAFFELFLFYPFILSKDSWSLRKIQKMICEISRFNFVRNLFLKENQIEKNIFLKCGNFRDNKRFFSLWLFFMLLTFSTTSFRYLNTLSGKGSCNRFFSWFFIQIIQVYVHISGFDRHGIFFPIISSFIVAMKKKTNFSDT